MTARAAVIESLALLAARGQSTSPPPIVWSNIVWDTATFGGKTLTHSALMVEVQLDSLTVPGIMQLDTGADALYTKTYDQLHPTQTPGDEHWIGLSGTVAGRPFKGDWFAHLRNFTDSAETSKLPVLGTIGLAFFERRILIIDFVAQKVAILAGNKDVPDTIAQRADFVPIDHRNGKIFIPVTLNGAEERELFFDSGSSAFALMTTRRRWLDLTGRQPEDAANSTVVAQSWGKDAHWIGAPLKGSMCVGKACLPQPLAFFEATGLPNLDFEKYPYKAAGNFGNLLFDGRYS